MNLKIMAVDDEPQILQLIKAFVGPMGMEVATSMDSRPGAESARVSSNVTTNRDRTQPRPAR